MAETETETSPQKNPTTNK